MLQRIGRRIPASSLATQSALAIAELALGTPLGGMTVSVGAIAVQGETAHHLGLRSGRPALVRAHTFFDPAGRPVLAGGPVLRGDKYRVTSRFGTGDLRTAPSTSR